MRRWVRLVALVATLSLVGAACGDDDDGDGAAGDTTTTAADGGETTTTAADDGDGGGEALEVVGVDYEFQDVPSELPAGLIDLTFRNEGEVEHELAMVSVGDTDMETFLADFAPVLEGGPFPEYAEHLALPAFASPGQTLETSFLVEEGEYVLFCTLDGEAGGGGEGGGGEGGGEEGGDGEAGATSDEQEGEEAAVPGGEEGTVSEGGEGEGGEGEGGGGEGGGGTPHYELGMAQMVTVTAGDGDASLPETDGSITARDYEFEVDVQAGEQTVAFLNEGPDQVHHAVIFPFTEGVDEERAATVLQEFLAAEEEGPPPPELDLESAEELGTGIFSPGLGQTLTMSFEPGRTYGFVCFLQDRSGGPPHAVAHDMYTVFTVE